MERLAARPGPAKKTVSHQDYDALKQELQEKERVIAETAVELAILRKKPMGVRGKDTGHLVPHPALRRLDEP
ncbi:MAG: hypothetical protein SWH78_17500 [Thermodesulfobacteriota bacterium]|nr:hypothetical protein [Thermodesulfobacteriota bacterium]